MTRLATAFALAVLLCAAPCSAAELIDADGVGAPRTGALAGGYVRLPLGAGSGAQTVPRSGLLLALTRGSGDVRSFASRREASLLEVRLGAEAPSGLYVVGQPVAGGAPDRMNAEGQSKGRLDKIMIGAGAALGAVAAFFLVSSFAD